MKNLMVIFLFMLLGFSASQAWTVHELKREQAALRTELADMSAEMENVENQLHVDRESVQE